MRSLTLALLALVGCTGTPIETSAPIVDPISGPSLSTSASDQVLLQGTDLPISVLADDPDGVSGVSLYFRSIGEPSWERLQLTLGDTNEWTGVIPSDQIQAPGVEFYFKGTDASDFEASSYLPTRGLDAPFSRQVALVGRPLPFSESFDSGSIYQNGWLEFSSAFAGYTWASSTGRAHSGQQSAQHRRGVAEGPLLDDWLVSPALDLRNVTSIEARWFEYGDNAQSATHSLWISTGSPNPADGDYELVQGLNPTPEDQWGASDYIDLSTWSGERAAFLAWRYEGQFADTWYIDDLLIQTMEPELQLIQVSPSAAQPGQHASLNVQLQNISGLPIPSLTVWASLDTTLGESPNAIQRSDIEGQQIVRAPLDLLISESVPNNRYLPVLIEATDGTRDWQWPIDLLVGAASSAQIDLSVWESSQVNLTLGTGDPEQPDLSLQVQLGELAPGSHHFEIDLTEHSQLLPASPSDRWWLQLDSDLAGKLTRFDLNWGGEVEASGDLHTFRGGEHTVFYLPQPPAPVLLSQSSTPDVLEPNMEAQLLLTLQNEGHITQGRTTLQVNSLDPDVLITSQSLSLLSETGWALNQPFDLALNLSILSTQDDSRPVPFELIVTDELEQFVIQTQLAVPWPVLQVTDVRVDDLFGGNSDGLLGVGEWAHLKISLTNAGDRDTEGVISCTLEPLTGVELMVASGNFGRISAGNTKSENDFKVNLLAGTPGDSLPFMLLCADSRIDYSVPLELVIDEQAWLLLSPFNDPIGDALDGQSFDFINGRYRSDGQSLDLILESATPYDPAQLFIESWMQSTGAGYDTYQLVVQSGHLSLRASGVDGFTTLSTPTLIELDERRIQVHIDLNSMDLALNRLELGFGSGFCGGGDYYCDHFPDGWGDPFQTGLIPARWTAIHW